jgi:RNA polymerase sigma-70 factor (ECF subfamily)
MEIINRYLLKIGCNRETAKDIVQDTMVKSLIYIDGIEKGKIKSWLFTVALNQYRDFCRKNKKWTELNSDVEYLNINFDDNQPETYILKKEEQKKVRIVLNQLKELYKQLLILKYEINLSYKEIAQVLDLNENTVKTYLFRARNEFKEKWNKAI